MLLILAFCLLNNILYKTTYDEEGNFKNNTVVNNEVNYEQELTKLDYNNINEVDEYIEVKNAYDLVKIIKDNNYSSTTWQYSVIYDQFYDIINNINYYTYKDKNEELKSKYIDELNLLIEKLETDDWKYFANRELKEIENKLNNYKDYLKIATSSEKTMIEQSIYNEEINKEIVTLRLNNDISYADSYLNTALINYKDNSINLYNIEKDKLTYQEKINYNELLSEKEFNKYIIENKYNINKENNLRSGIKSLITDYEIFIVLFIIIISSSIVSSEFKDGTIKQLLTRPYTRNTVLLSKYITCIISLLFIVFYTLTIEFIIGTICFGTSSLKIPVLIYNYNTSNLITLNAVVYMLLILVNKLPIYILLITLSFTISTLFTSTSLANTLTILGYMFSSTFYVIYNVFNLKFLKYFVTLNWDLTEYLYGSLPKVEGLTRNISILVCLFYFIIMIVITFNVFNKKNIKNI